MNVQGLSDQDLRALVKYGTNGDIIRQAVNELAERLELRGRSVVDLEFHKLDVVGSIPTPATILKGRWNS